MCEECGGGLPPPAVHQEIGAACHDCHFFDLSVRDHLGGISTPGLADFKANRPWHTSRSLWPLLSPDGSKRQLIIDL